MPKQRKDQSQLVRYKKGKHTFEVATNPGEVRKYRQGRCSLADTLAVELVFSNYSKKTQPTAAALSAAFGTSDLNAVLDEILQQGALNLSSAERKEDLQQKQRAIVSYVVANWRDPRGTPVPATRIEQALKNVKFRVDPVKSTRTQAGELVRAMQGVVALSKNQRDVTITANERKQADAVLGVLNKAGLTAHSVRGADLPTFHVSIAHGEVDAVIAALNTVTDGNYQWIEGHTTTSASATPDEGGRRGKQHKKKARGTNGDSTTSRGRGSGRGAKAKGRRRGR